MLEEVYKMEILASISSIEVAMPDGSVAALEECPLQLICALGIVRGVNTVEDVYGLSLVSFEEYEKALSLVGSTQQCPPGSPTESLDVLRCMRDSKYALHLQEVVLGTSVGTTSSAMIRACKSHVLQMSLNCFACRVVQKLVEVGPVDEVVTIILGELEDHCQDLALDIQGNHVLQKLIDVLPPHLLKKIVDELTPPVARLSAHCYGCRVVQRLITRIRPPAMLEALSGDSGVIAALSKDVFGNYVMQVCLEQGRDIDRERIMLCLATLDVVELGCCKFASNVVEKLIRVHNTSGLSTPNAVMATRLLINSLLTLKDPVSGLLQIMVLMTNSYGNYIVRAIIELTNPDFSEEIAIVKRLIRENVNLLKKYTFSWHLVERLEKLNGARERGF